MADRVLTVDILVEGQAAQRALLRLQDTGEKAAGGVRGMFGKITPTLGDVQRILGQVVDGAKDFGAAAEEEERTQTRLISVLKARNTYSAAGVKISNDWTAATSRQLGIDDELLTNMQAQIATLTNLSGDALNQATQATLGFADATGKSNDAAAIAVSKFLMAGGTLRGLKVDVDANASAQTKLAALTDATGAGWANLIAQGNTFQGNMNKIALAWENVKEKVGSYITTSDAVPKMTDAIIKGLDWLVDTLSGTNEPFNDFVSDVKTIIGALVTFAERVQGVIDAINRLRGIQSKDPLFQTGGRAPGVNWSVPNSPEQTGFNPGYDPSAGIDYSKKTAKSIEGHWSDLSDKLVGHSIIPDMMSQVRQNFERLSQDVGGIMSGLIRTTQMTASRTALPWMRGAYNARTGGYDNPFGAEYYDGGNMLGQNQAVKGSVVGGGRVAVSARIENLDELAQALNQGGNIRLAEAQVG